MKLLTIVLAGVLAFGALSAAAEEQMTCCNATYADGVYTIENTAPRAAYVKYVYEWNQTEVKPFYFGGEYFAQAADPKDKGIAAIRVDLEFTDGTKLPWVNIGMPNNQKFEKTVRPFTAKKPIKTATLIAQFNRVGKIQMRSLFAKEGVLPAAAAPAKPAPKAPPAGMIGSKTNVPDGENWVSDPMFMSGATFKDGVYTFDNAAPNKTAALIQTCHVDQQEPKPFTFSVESKGSRPESEPRINYSIFVDIVHQDGTKINCINVPIRNSDDFVKSIRTFVPKKPVKTATLYIWCKMQGKAEFKAPSLVFGK